MSAVSSGKTTPLFIPQTGIYIYSYELTHDGRTLLYARPNGDKGQSVVA